jgi:hypothetical protein
MDFFTGLKARAPSARTALLLHELLLGRSECIQVRCATDTLDLIEEVIDHDPQALIFRCQLNDRAMQG